MFQARRRGTGGGDVPKACCPGLLSPGCGISLGRPAGRVRQQRMRHPATASFTTKRIPCRSVEGKIYMNATQKLHNLGQSLWLDNITRDLLDTGTLQRYIEDLSITGLTSNPTIFDHAIKGSPAYDAAIREKLKEGRSGEALFFELALEDIVRAADMFRPVHDRTNG